MDLPLPPAVRARQSHAGAARLQKNTELRSPYDISHPHQSEAVGENLTAATIAALDLPSRLDTPQLKRAYPPFPEDLEREFDSGVGPLFFTPKLSRQNRRDIPHERPEKQIRQPSIPETAHTIRPLIKRSRRAFIDDDIENDGNKSEATSSTDSDEDTACQQDPAPCLGRWFSLDVDSAASSGLPTGSRNKAADSNANGKGAAKICPVVVNHQPE